MAHSSSSSTTEYKNEKRFFCNCNRLAKIFQSWTDDNPGRRFYRCPGRKVLNGYESCKFFVWYDVEAPHGWQRDALIGARDVINQQKEEIKSLRNKVRALTIDSESVEQNENERNTVYVKQACEECEALKKEVLVLKERSMVNRNVLITSSIGFTVVLGVVVGMLKW